MSLSVISGAEKSKRTSLLDSTTKKNNCAKIAMYGSTGLSCDVFDDGKISAQEGFNSFISGMILPFKSLFSSPKSFAIGAGAIVVTAGLCAAAPPLLPVMVIAGIATGGVQLGKGIYNAKNAKTDSQAKKAWESIGSGTFSIGTSVLGAKSSIKAAGIEVADDINMFSATIKCFKELPSSVSKSFKMFKNGTALESIKNALKKPINYSDLNDVEQLKKAGYNEDKLIELKNYGKMLHEEGTKAVKPENATEGIIQDLNVGLPDSLKDRIQYRVKSPSSIKDKLIKKMTDKKSPVRIDSLDDARRETTDLIGTRVILEKATPDEVESLVENLCSAMQNNKIKLLEIENYKGEGIPAYFSADNIDALREAAKASNSDIGAFEGSGIWHTSDKIKKSGYTTTQMNITHSDGSLGEFQIRGKEIEKIAQVEHIPYDLRQNKDLSGGNHLLKKLYKPLENKVGLLSNDGYKEYNNYLNALYKYYRSIETGSTGAVKPKLKDYIKSKPSEFIDLEKIPTSEPTQHLYNNIINMLDIDNIEKLHNDAKWIKAIPRTTIIRSLLHGTSKNMAIMPEQQITA